VDWDPDRQLDRLDPLRLDDLRGRALQRVHRAVMNGEHCILERVVVFEIRHDDALRARIPLG